MVSEDDEDYQDLSLSSDGSIAQPRYERTEQDYAGLHKFMLDELASHNISQEKFLEYELEILPEEPAAQTDRLNVIEGQRGR